jgi:hypothetical protein
MVLTESAYAQGSGRAVAQTQGKRVTPAETVQQMSVAHSLIEDGETHHDALALLKAARIFSALSPFKERRIVKSGPLAASLDRISMAAVFATSIDKVVERATLYAVGKPDLIAAASRLRKDSAAKARKSPYRDLNSTAAKSAGSLYVDFVPGKSSNQYDASFDAGARAAAYIEDQGKTAGIVLSVVDSKGAAICPESRARPDYCEWVSKEAGPVRLLVANTGDQPTTFVLAIN